VPDSSRYDLEMRRVGRGRGQLILPLVAAIAFVIVAVGASLLTSRRPLAAPTSLAPAAAVLVDCGAVRAHDCSEAVEAARRAIADSPTSVAKARAWPGLICGDNFDCPPPLLASSDPVGSVALTLADQAVVWVNVLRVDQPNRLDETRQILEARVVRWFPATP
jgi:hypothetical protein